jgi:hypothetical protein
MAGSPDGALGVEVHQPVERRLGQDAQEIPIIALLDSGHELGQCVVGLRFRSFSCVTSGNATLPGFFDDRPSRRPRPGRALALAVRATEALRRRVNTTSVDATLTQGWTARARKLPAGHVQYILIYLPGDRFALKNMSVNRHPEPIVALSDIVVEQINHRYLRDIFGSEPDVSVRCAGILPADDPEPAGRLFPGASGAHQPCREGHS